MPYQDLSQSLKKLITDKKVLLQIDGANLYFGASSKKWTIDFNQIYNWFKESAGVFQSIYYTAYNPEEPKQSVFIADLETTGYQVFKKPIKVMPDESVKGNLDVEVTVDSITNIFLYEVFVLVSGDGDFTYLVQTLEKLGKKVIILGVGGFVSYDLHKQADNFFFLDRIKKVWQKPKNSKGVEIKDDGLEILNPAKKERSPRTAREPKKTEKLKAEAPKPNTTTAQSGEIYI